MEHVWSPRSIPSTTHAQTRLHKVCPHAYMHTIQRSWKYQLIFEKVSVNIVLNYRIYTNPISFLSQTLDWKWFRKDTLGVTPFYITSPLSLGTCTRCRVHTQRSDSTLWAVCWTGPAVLPSVKQAHLPKESIRGQPYRAGSQATRRPWHSQVGTGSDDIHAHLHGSSSHCHLEPLKRP